MPGANGCEAGGPGGGIGVLLFGSGLPHINQLKGGIGVLLFGSDVPQIDRLTGSL